MTFSLVVALRAWIAARVLAIAVRLAAWAAWLATAVAYAGYVAWRVRRLTKGGALDERRPGDPPAPVSARDRGVLAWIRGDGIHADPTPGTPTPPVDPGGAPGERSQ